MRINVCPRDELEEGVVKVFEEGDVEGIVVRSGNVIYACDRYCTHELFPLEFGQLPSAGILRCTLHGSEFNLATGDVLGPPATAGLKTYTVEIDGDDIVVEVPEESS